MGGRTASGLAAALGDDARGVLADWLESFEQSPLRVPSPVDRPALLALVEPAFRALADAVASSPDAPHSPRPGSRELRETERLFSFMGASLASATVSSRQSSAFDASALGTALRDALGRRCSDESERRALQPLCDWLTALLVESFASAGRQGERERFHELLETRVLAVAISPKVAAALAIGDAESAVLASALERLILQVARLGTRAVVVDVSSLDGAHLPHNLQALEQFVSHRKVAGAMRIAAVGLTSEAAVEWGRLAASHSVELHVCETFLEASVWAHEGAAPSST